jgi:hypothetical protein
MPIFNRAAHIPKGLRETFRSALGLPMDTLKQIGEWIKGHPDFIENQEVDSSELESAATALKLTKSEFAGALSLVATLLFSGNTPDGFLKELGLGDHEEKARLLLSAVALPSAEVEYSRQKSLALGSAIPTLDDVDALCDLRAVFGRLPSGSSSEAHLKQVKTILGFEAVVVVGMKLNDAAGEDSAYVFQVSERGLHNLIKTLQQAMEQVHLIKSVQKTLVLPDTTL